MLCEEVMTTEVEYASLRESIESVAARMRDADIGWLPVCDDVGHVLGTVCERDIIVKLVAYDMSARTPAGAVMTRDVVSCRQDEDVRSVTRRMREARAVLMPCVDEAGRLVGVIRLADITPEAQHGHDIEERDTKEVRRDRGRKVQPAQMGLAGHVRAGRPPAA